MTTWKELIAEAMTEADDTGPLIYATLTIPEMDVEFHSGYGGSQGKPFTAWTKTRVYFPVVYDGAEWVSSAPRNPCDEETRHCGGQ